MNAIFQVEKEKRACSKRSPVKRWYRSSKTQLLGCSASSRMLQKQQVWYGKKSLDSKTLLVLFVLTNAKSRV